MDILSFPQVVLRGCGIDVHKIVVVATINDEGLGSQTREFGTFTSSLTEWLLSNGIMHVAMESTGVYWKPVYNVLEGTALVVWIASWVGMCPGNNESAGKKKRSNSPGKQTRKVGHHRSGLGGHSH